MKQKGFGIGSWIADIAVLCGVIMAHESTGNFILLLVGAGLIIFGITIIARLEAVNIVLDNLNK